MRFPNNSGIVNYPKDHQDLLRYTLENKLGADLWVRWMDKYEFITFVMGQ